MMTNPLTVYPGEPSGPSRVSFAIDTEIPGFEALLPEPNDEGKTRNALVAMYQRTLDSGHFGFIRSSQGERATNETADLAFDTDEGSIGTRLASWQQTAKDLEAIRKETAESWKKLMPAHGKKPQSIHDRGGAPASRAERSVLLTAYSYWLLDKALSLSRDHLNWSDDILSSSNSRWIRSKQEYNHLKRETDDRVEREMAEAHTPTRFFLNAVSYPFRRLSFGSQSLTTHTSNELQEGISDPVALARQAVDEASKEYQGIREAYFGLDNRDQDGNCADLTRIVALLRSVEVMSQEMEGFTALVDVLKAERAKHTYIKSFLEGIKEEGDRLARDLQSIMARTEEGVDRRDGSGYWISTSPRLRLVQPDHAAHCDQPYSQHSEEERYASDAGTSVTDDEGAARSESGGEATDREEEDRPIRQEDPRLNSWQMTDEEYETRAFQGWQDLEKREEWRKTISQMTAKLQEVDDERILRIGTRFSRKNHRHSQSPSSSRDGFGRNSLFRGNVDPKWHDERVKNTSAATSGLLPLPPLAALTSQVPYLDGLVDAPSPEVNRWGYVAAPSWADESAEATQDAGDFTPPTLQQPRSRPESHPVTRWLAEARLAALYQNDSQSGADQAYDQTLVSRLKEVLQPRTIPEDILGGSVPYYERAVSEVPTASGAYDDLAIDQSQPSFSSAATLRGARRYSLIGAESLSPAVEWAVRQAETAKRKVKEEEAAQMRFDAMPTSMKKAINGHSRGSRFPTLTISPPA